MSKGATGAGYRSVPGWTRTGFTKDIDSAREAFRTESRFRQLQRGVGVVLTPGPSTNLRAVIEGAPAGATIRLGEGNFSLTGYVNITKSITIVGIGNSTVLEWPDTGTAQGFDVLAADVNIRDLRMVQTSAIAAFLTIGALRCTLDHVEIVQPAGTVQFGVRVAIGDATIRECAFPAAAPGASAIYFDDGVGGGIVCGNRGNTYAAVLDYQLGAVIANGCNLGVVNVRP